MQNLLLTIAAALTLFASPSFPQASQAGESKPITMDGQVRSYEPGKSLEIELRPMVAQTFNLSSSSTRYAISPDVRVGSKVEVIESKSETGQKTVEVHVKR